MSVEFLEFKQFLYNSEGWGIEEAYRAFGEQMSIYRDLGFLETHTGRVWLVESWSRKLYDVISSMENTRVLSESRFFDTYQNHEYIIILIEMENYYEKNYDYNTSL